MMNKSAGWFCEYFILDLVFPFWVLQGFYDGQYTLTILLVLSFSE